MIDLACVAIFKPQGSSRVKGKLGFQIRRLGTLEIHACTSDISHFYIEQERGSLNMQRLFHNWCQKWNHIWGNEL